MFEGWNDDQFVCWLAGFFDGEGCIHLPKKGIEVSIASTDMSIIDGIQQRVGVGVVNVVTYDRVEWKTKYQWRVRNYPHASVVLRMIRPFLTIKAEKADEALERTDGWDRKRQAYRDRNEQILAAVASGMNYVEVGKAFGLVPDSISFIVRGIVRDGSHPTKVKDIRQWRNSHETKAVKSAGLGVRTTSHTITPLPFEQP